MHQAINLYVIVSYTKLGQCLELSCTGQCHLGLPSILAMYVFMQAITVRMNWPHSKFCIVLSIFYILFRCIGL